MGTPTNMPGAGGVTVGSITRSIRALTLGTVEAYHDKRVRDWEGAKDEYDQQFQLPFYASITPFQDPGQRPEGQITRDMWQTTVSVDFAVGFFYAPNERANGLSVPTFTYGVEHKSGQPALVTAMVKNWKGGSGGVAGANVIVVVGYPGARKRMQLNGILHLSFQGYGMPKQPAAEPTTDDEG